MMQTVRDLRSRFFGTAEEEEEEIRQDELEVTMQRAAASEFTHSTHYETFKSWLEIASKENEPRPGVQEDMLYQCGLRDGIRLVQDHLAELENFARNQ